ncbi:MAG: V-type ATPase subunit [Candidatus Nanohaloarchaea archaeon]
MIPKDYPYMYARVSAKKKKLYTERDYDNFLKMQVNDISRKMEEGSYKTEINELGSEYDGAELIEKALNLNLANTYENLLKVASDDAKPIIRVYLRRFDIINIKRIIRWKETDQSEKIEHILYPIGTLGLGFEEIRENSVEEILEDLNFENSRVDYQAEIEDCETVGEIETCLDRLYSEELRDLADSSGSKEFQKFVKDEQFNQDLKIALRLKRYNIEKEEILERLFNHKDELEELLESENFEDALKLAGEMTELEAENMEEFEKELDRDRLQRALNALHREPLGLSSMIGYIVAKEIEIENMRMIARAKETGIQNNETIKKNLVTM